MVKTVVTVAAPTALMLQKKCLTYVIIMYSYSYLLVKYSIAAKLHFFG